jgi:hypothetical protein
MERNRSWFYERKIKFYKLKKLKKPKKVLNEKQNQKEKYSERKLLREEQSRGITIILGPKSNSVGKCLKTTSIHWKPKNR